MSHCLKRLSETGFAEPLSKLHELCFDRAWSPDDFTRYLSSDAHAVIGALEGSELVGFIVTQQVADQAEILTIAVSRAFRRLGHGRALVSEAQRELERLGIEILFLDVAEDNPAAIALYREMGYHGCGRRPGYYRRENGRVAALLMQKHLNKSL